MESYLLPGHLLRHFFILGGVYIKKRILCFILSVLVVLSAYSSASNEVEQVSAAVVIDDVAAVTALLAACGLVYTAAVNWDDYEDAIGDISDKSVDIMQACLDKAGVYEIASGFDPDNDDPNEKPATWEKLIQWIKNNPGKTIMTTGTTMAMILLQFANALKDDVDVNSGTIYSIDSSLHSLLAKVKIGLYNCGSNDYFTNSFNSACNAGNIIGTADVYYNYYLYTSDNNISNGYDSICFVSNGDGKLYGYLCKNGDYLLSTSMKTYRQSSYGMSSVGNNEGPGGKFMVSSDSSLCYINPDYSIYYDGTLISSAEKDFLTTDTVKFGSSLQTDENGDITALPVPSISAGNLADNWDSLSSNLGTAVNTGGDVQPAVDAIIDAVAQPLPDPEPDSTEDPEGGGSVVPNPGEDPDIGGDTGEDTDSANFSTLWEWLRKILEAIIALPAALIDLLKSFFETLWEWLKQILDAILSLPELLSGLFQTLWNWLQSIIDAIANGAASLAEWLEQIWDSICNIPEAIGDLIKSIFVPDTAELQAIYDDLNESVGNIFGIDNYDLDNLWSDSGPPDDIYGDLDFGSYHYSGVIASFRFLIDGVDKFRKYIRGFVVLMLVIYNIRQALSMFGLSSGEIAAAHAYDTSHGNKYSGGGN